MAEEPTKSNRILMVTTIITVAGAIIAAIITVSGNIKVEKIRQNAELSRSATQPTVVPKTDPTSVPVTITLTNYNCYAQDYYVDDQKMASIPAGETVFFNTAPGPHQVLACTTGSSTCGDPAQIIWEVSTTAVINPHPSCPVTISLTNKHCESQDYYVDDTLMVSSIAANTNVQFAAVPGLHRVYACNPGTSICGSAVELDWSRSTSAEILPGPGCP